MLARAEYRGRWRCEGCGEVVSYLQCAHLFSKGGRRAGISEAWASTPQLCAALCCALSWPSRRIGCHEKYDQHKDAALEARLGWMAVERLYEYLMKPAGLTRDDDEPQDVVRRLLREFAPAEPTVAA